MTLLDTHALLWWVDSDVKLSSHARHAIKKEQKTGKLGVSAISIWEVCLLIKGGRLTLRVDLDTWLADISAVPFLQIIPIDMHIAKISVFLPNWPHKDPADRIIVATAFHLGVPLVTGDAKIRAYKQVRTVW